MEDRFASIAKTTSGWVYIVKYFAELEIKHDKGNFEKAASWFQGIPFFYQGIVRSAFKYVGHSRKIV